MSSRIHDFQLKNAVTKAGVRMAGGMALIVAAGTCTKVACQDPITLASAANPVLLTQGRLTFAHDAATTAVDAYIMTPTGHFIVIPNIKPGDRQEVEYNAIAPRTAICLPILGSDYTAAAENSTGITLPRGLEIDPDAVWDVKTAQSAKTVDVGILSTESNGDADGFLVGISLAATGIIAAKSATTATRGALLGAGTLDKGYVTDGVAKTISITPSSGTTTAAALVVLEALVSPFLFATM